ncbi:MAG: NTP transferase domain-containing protein [Promethearchaeota archaeon]
MVFVKEVRSGSKVYYYLVHSYRVGNSVHQKTIKRLTSAEARDPNLIRRFLENNPGYRKKGVKAIILAAGKALRLLPYAQNMPKGLIIVGNKPILQHAIECLNTCGINEIILVTGYQEEKLRKYFKEKVKYIYNPFYTVSNILASLWLA